MTAYDPNGSTVDSTASWTYDGLGQVIDEYRTVYARNYHFRYTYTQGGLPYTVRYPDGSANELGEVVRTTYWWQTGQAKTLQGNMTPSDVDNDYELTYVTQADYNEPTGQMSQLKLPTGTGQYITTDYTYNSAFRLERIRTVAFETERFDLAYTYDKVGNILSIVDDSIISGAGFQTQQFTYDSLNRLVKACTLSGSSCSTNSNSGQYSDTYSYDAVGNLINNDGTYLGYGGPNPGIQNGARPHLVTHFSGNPTPRYVYDANGNMTSRNDGTTTWTNTWTQENMLQQATAGTTSVTMIHDGDNQLMRRVENVNGVVTTLIYLGKLLENTVTPGDTYKKYYLFNGKPVAMREGLSSGNVSYFVTDHLSSINTTLWADGSVRSDLRYYPFGKERWFVDVTPTGVRFTAQRWDSKLGLYDYNARFYDPQIGRFISADTIVPSPASPQTLNRFAYVYNNPIRYVDPTGHAGSATLHRFVQIYFSAAILPGTIPNLQMKNNEPDLVFSLIVDGRTVANYVWEVKPVSNYGNPQLRSSALAQRDRYINALPKGVAGPTIEVLTGKPTYTIPYHPYDENMVIDIFSGKFPGMIFYKERPKTKKERNLPQEDLAEAYAPAAQAVPLQDQQSENEEQLQGAIPEENGLPSPARPIPYADFQDELLTMLIVAGELQFYLGGGDKNFALAY